MYASLGLNELNLFCKNLAEQLHLFQSTNSSKIFRAHDRVGNIKGFVECESKCIKLNHAKMELIGDFGWTAHTVMGAGLHIALYMNETELRTNKLLATWRSLHHVSGTISFKLAHSCRIWKLSLFTWHMWSLSCHRSKYGHANNVKIIEQARWMAFSATFENCQY